MWIFIGVGLVIFWFLFIRKQSCVDTMQETETKELLWRIKGAAERMKHGDLTLASTHLTYASVEWTALLEIKEGTLLLTLNPWKIVSSSYPENVFLGVGIEQGRVEALFYWYEVKISKPYTVQGWQGPCRAYLVENKDLIMPDGLLTVFVRMSTFPSPFCVFSKNSEGNDAAEMDKSSGVGNRCCHNYKVLNKLSKNLKDLYLEDKEHDVNIKVRNETLRAHRPILKARCPVLAALISQQTSEEGTAELLEEDCDPKVFADFLLFLYSGTADHLTNENVTSVYNIADKYDVLDLMEACAKYMLSDLTVHSVTSVIAVALKHKDFKLLDRATEFFLRRAEEIFPTAEWQTLLRENPTKANELVIKSYSYNKSKDV